MLLSLTGRVLASTFTALLFLYNSPSLVSSDGIIELNLVSYYDMTRRDESGECCSGTSSSVDVCTESCNNYITFCLKETTAPFQTSFDPINPKLPVQSFNFTGINNRRQLAFGGKFTDYLILQINVSNQIADENDRLVASLSYPFAQRERVVSLGGKWAVEGFSYPLLTPDVTQWIVFKWRATCTANYVKDCEVYCQSKDDSTGHYVCDSEGRKTCLPGYEDPSTDCVKPLDICQSHPCQNGGTCNSTNECHCSTILNPCDEASCHAADWCETVYGCAQKPSYTCKCDNGFSGSLCERNSAAEKNRKIEIGVPVGIGGLFLIGLILYCGRRRYKKSVETDSLIQNAR